MSGGFYCDQCGWEWDVSPAPEIGAQPAFETGPCGAHVGGHEHRCSDVAHGSCEALEAARRGKPLKVRFDGS